MATDNLTVLQASTTKTATAHSAAFSLPTGTPRRGLFVRILYSAAATTSGTASCQFDVDASPTAGGAGTYYTHTSGAEQILSLTSTAQSGEIWLPVETTDPYIRVTTTLTDTGSEVGMTVTFQADLVLGFPS